MLHGLLASEDEIPAYLGKADRRMNGFVQPTHENEEKTCSPDTVLRK